MYLIKFGKQAEEDKQRLKEAGLEQKAKALLDVIATNPFRNPPPCASLCGKLEGYYLGRINLQHRLVYEVSEETIEENGIVYEGTVRVVRMWTDYDRKYQESL